LNSKGSFVVVPAHIFFFLCYGHACNVQCASSFPRRKVSLLSPFAALADYLSVSIEEVSFLFSDCSVSSYSSSSSAAAA
jgi:hypothetical protein